MTYEIVIPVIIAFAISALLGPVVIPFLRKLKVGQTERKELESHLKKNGTPTMGGIMILASIIITSLFYVKDYPKIIPILFMTVGFGVIGFLDDYLKVVLRRSDGLLAWQKMILQIIVTGVFAVYMVKYSGVALTMLIPFSGGKYLDLGWLAIPVLFFAVVGTVNGSVCDVAVFPPMENPSIFAFFPLPSETTLSKRYRIVSDVSFVQISFFVSYRSVSTSFPPSPVIFTPKCGVIRCPPLIIEETVVTSCIGVI